MEKKIKVKLDLNWILIYDIIIWLLFQSGYNSNMII